MLGWPFCQFVRAYAKLELLFVIGVSTLWDYLVKYFQADDSLIDKGKNDGSLIVLLPGSLDIAGRQIIYSN